MTSALSPLTATAFVAAGGAIGAVGRYALGQAFAGLLGSSGFPWAILSVNILGSLAMGLLFGWFASHDGGTETQRLFLAVGILGGFTTFSAFSLEIILLIQRGAIALACAFIAASVIGGVAALYLGLTLAKGSA
ncbi:MAG: fluoride efflux transporter CrcB [Pseudomonadota bacterium]